ncbi:MAG: hypothetical protein M3443_04735 [Actinomycetota bacterium]|nr:hypothetical protein [Actinomycetota bacterium]
MTGPAQPSPSLVRLLALRRVRRGGVVAHGDELFTDHGHKIPAYVQPHLQALLAEGYLDLGDPDTEGDQHTLGVTETGLLLYAALKALHPRPATSTTRSTWPASWPDYRSSKHHPGSIHT